MQLIFILTFIVVKKNLYHTGEGMIKMFMFFMSYIIFVYDFMRIWTALPC